MGAGGEAAGCAQRRSSCSAGTALGSSLAPAASSPCTISLLMLPATASGPGLSSFHPHCRLGSWGAAPCSEGSAGLGRVGSTHTGRVSPGAAPGWAVSHAEMLRRCLAEWEGRQTCPARASTLPPPHSCCPEAPTFHPSHPPAPGHSTQLGTQARTPSPHPEGCSWHPDETEGTRHVLSPLWWPYFPSYTVPGCFGAMTGSGRRLQLHSLLRQVLWRPAAENCPPASLLQLASPAASPHGPLGPAPSVAGMLGQQGPLHGPSH